MVNYQLYRTNPKLGGQMKIDLVVDKSGNDLSVGDIHITPINYKVPYNRHSRENLINYSHQENISRFYRDTQGSFYKDMPDLKLTNPWPIVSKIVYDTHDNTYEMGLRRMRYGLYGKQFNFLIPLWLEKVEDLSFNIEIWSSNKKGHVNKLIEKRLSIFNNQQPEDKISEYIKNYFKYIGIYWDGEEGGNDNCLAIHLDKGTSQISGLDVMSGSNKVIDLPYLVKNLTSRERSLLEFDNMIINQFEDNGLIAHQLVNFNLCFNLEDIIPNSFIQEFMGGQFGVKVFTQIGDNKLDIVDFFSNYEFIPRKECGPMPLSDTTQRSGQSTTPNVLEYLKDYNCVDIIDKNKIVQSTIHWSLIDNNDYILNAYNGFGGYINDGEKIIKIPYLYDNTPDLISDVYSKSLNNIGWANHIELPSNEEYGPSISSIAGNIVYWYEKASDFSNRWVNNIKYNEKDPRYKLKVLTVYTEEYLEDDEKIKTIYTDDNPNLKERKHIGILTWSARDLFWTEDNAFLVFISNDRNLLTFRGILNKKPKSDDEKLNDYLDTLFAIMKSADPSSNPPLISIGSTVDLVKTKAPSLSATEHEYVKNDNKGICILRYSGKVRPTFINPINTSDINFNFEYYKDLVENYNKSKYRLYDGSGLSPKFPSIDYFSILKQKQDYVNLNPDFDQNIYEFTRFNNNLIVLTPSEVSLQCTANNKEDVERAIDDSLKFIDMDINYIKSLYDISINFDYIDDTNINSYNYDIKLKLK